MKKILLLLWLLTGQAWGQATIHTESGVSQEAPTASISAGTLTIDLSKGTEFTVSNTANITTFNVINCAGTGRRTVFVVRFVANGSSYTQVYPGTTKWPSATAPTLSTTNGYIDYIGFDSTDGCVNFLGAVLGQAYH